MQVSKRQLTQQELCRKRKTEENGTQQDRKHALWQYA